ncbi:probable boron transporter 2 [Arachis hypogaea]|uniref:probable boron transporter 2 n=1 Tax=Arachis hypogaea TaxID=3818 RepID=UPI003B20B9B8
MEIWKWQFALVLSFGLLLTALRSRKARSWPYGSGYAGCGNYVYHWSIYSCNNDCCALLFDHSVAYHLAQQKEFNLRKPLSFHYDLLLLGFMVILCGLIGIPPSNGVIPQSPMHTKSLATLKHQILRNQLVATARSCITKKSSLGQLYESM